MLFRGTQDGRVLAYDFKTGKRLWETTIADREKGRVGAVGADRLGGPRLHRQRRRRLQGRQGAHVRARRQDRQDRLGILPGSQGRGRHGPRAAGRVAARHVDLEKRARHPDQRRRDLDVLHARPENRAACTSPAAIRRPTSRSACARATISSPTRSSCSTPRPAPTRIISSSCRRTGTTGTSPTRRS